MTLRILAAISRAIVARCLRTIGDRAVRPAPFGSYLLVSGVDHRDDPNTDLGRTHLLHASTEQDFDGAPASLLQLRHGLVIGAGDPFFVSRCNQLVELAKRISVPTIYPWRKAVVAGGLVSYGGNTADNYRLAGSCAGRILRGISRLTCLSSKLRRSSW